MIDRTRGDISQGAVGKQGLPEQPGRAGVWGGDGPVWEPGSEDTRRRSAWEAGRGSTEKRLRPLLSVWEALRWQ